MRFVPVSLVVSWTFVSLPLLICEACAITAVFVAASTTTYRRKEETINPKKTQVCVLGIVLYILFIYSDCQGKKVIKAQLNI